MEYSYPWKLASVDGKRAIYHGNEEFDSFSEADEDDMKVLESMVDCKPLPCLLVLTKYNPLGCAAKGEMVMLLEKDGADHES